MSTTEQLKFISGFSLELSDRPVGDERNGKWSRKYAILQYSFYSMYEKSLYFSLGIQQHLLSLNSVPLLACCPPPNTPSHTIRRHELPIAWVGMLAVASGRLPSLAGGVNNFRSALYGMCKSPFHTKYFSSRMPIHSVLLLMGESGSIWAWFCQCTLFLHIG